MRHKFFPHSLVEPRSDLLLQLLLLLLLLLQDYVGGAAACTRGFAALSSIRSHVNELLLHLPLLLAPSAAAAPGAASGLPAAATGAGSAGTPWGAGSQWRWTLGRNDRKKVAVTALCLQGEVPLEMQQVRNSLLLLALLLLVIHLLLELLFPY